MGGVLVVGSAADDGVHLATALRERGITAVALPKDGDVEIAARDKDAILVDLDAAIARGWVRRSERSQKPRAPLIVMSRHQAFLEVVHDQVAGVLLTPFEVDDVVGTIQRVVDRKPVPLPARSLHPIDAPGRDLAVKRFLGDRDDPELFGAATLVARATESDIALVTVLDSQWQTFVGHYGLETDLLQASGTRRDWAFCTHTIAGGERMVVTDTHQHPLFASNPLVEAKMVASYAGVPIVVPGFGVVGTVCVMSKEPRQYDARALAVLDLAAHFAAERLSRHAEEKLHSGAVSDVVHRGGAPNEPIAVGALVDGRYWVTAKLSSGGEAEVFLARERVVGRLVVIKWRVQRGEQPLFTEARGLAAVRHPNIVHLYGWGYADGRPYLVLEHVRGPSLDLVVREHRGRGEPIPLPRVADIIHQLAGALASMHGAGYLHGDVKPGNVIVDVELDRPVLIDFGFSLPIGAAEAAPVHGGTPGFSAPEQFMSRGVALDARADVYALATLAYTLLTGAAPFGETASSNRIALQLAERIEPASSQRPDTPKAVDALLARAMSSDPAHRPDSVLAFATELEEAMAEPRAATVSIAPEPGVPQSRGLALRVYRESVRAKFGAAEDKRVVAALSPEDREICDSHPDDDVHIPTRALIAYLRTFAIGDPSRLAALARVTATTAIPRVFAALGVTRTPPMLVRAAEVLLHRFHDWGRLDIDWRGPGNARVQLDMPPDLAPEMCAYLAEVTRVLLATTGRASSVTELSCRARGAQACTFDVQWAID